MNYFLFGESRGFMTALFTANVVVGILFFTMGTVPLVQIGGNIALIAALCMDYVHDRVFAGVSTDMHNREVRR